MLKLLVSLSLWSRRSFNAFSTSFFFKAGNGDTKFCGRNISEGAERDGLTHCASNAVPSPEMGVARVVGRVRCWRGVGMVSVRAGECSGGE